MGEGTVAILRAIDKLPKIGADAVARELIDRCGASREQSDEILRFVGLTGTNEEVVERLGPFVEGSASGDRGVEELGELLAGVTSAGIDPRRLRVDVSIARGLDYYTGTVYETFLDDLRDIGSCCSGGRYDDLASLYTTQELPGVGASLGVDRLLAAMEELDLVERRSASAAILVTVFDAALAGDSIAIAASLRRAGLATELYPEPRKLGPQLKYANRRGHRLAIVIGPAESEAGTAQVKDLASGKSVEVTRDELAAECRALLGKYA